MKKLRLPKSKKELVWHSFEDTFSKVLGDKKFKKVYEEEVARLRLAQRVREMRLKKNMTQGAVAEKASMPQSVIARLESGEHSVSLDTLNRVAHALGKKVELV